MKNNKTINARLKRAEKSLTAAKKDVFVKLIESTFKTECVRELRFHDKRRWRFDYALPRYRVAVEIDGGVWQYGRHNRASGYLGDMEKMREAAALGWLVLHFTPREQFTSTAFELIGRAIHTRLLTEGYYCNNDNFSAPK